MKPWLRTLIGVLLGAFVLGVPLWAMLSSSGCSTPPTPAKVAKAANDLCLLRQLERAVLELEPKLQPPPDSMRAKVQRTEDEFCASLADASTPPPLDSPPDASPAPALPSASAPPPAPS